MNTNGEYTTYLKLALLGIVEEDLRVLGMPVFLRVNRVHLHARAILRWCNERLVIASLHVGEPRGDVVLLVVNRLEATLASCRAAVVDIVVRRRAAAGNREDAAVLAGRRGHPEARNSAFRRRADQLGGVSLVEVREFVVAPRLLESRDRLVFAVLAVLLPPATRRSISAALVLALL